jgi:hypothetical protein
MRLSEERIRFISKRIAGSMIRNKAVDSAIGHDNLSTLIAQVLIKDLRIEDEIDSEARQMLLRQRNLPPEGSGEYEALFLRLKEQVAARKGYPL